MKCYKCGSFLYDGEYCTSCGADVSMYRKIVVKSNQLYNSALEFAKDRNLSKAVENLEASLKLYKSNINAHNLLGLIYFEMGEYALGFAHWIISKSIQSDNNLANSFLEMVQEDKSYQEDINSAIKKYNKAMSHIDQKNYDLAEIQLKKLLNDENIHMLKGLQLLALLRIRKKKYAAALKAIDKAMQIDAGNATTISYKTFVNSQLKKEEKDLTPVEIKNKRKLEKTEGEQHTPLSGDDVIIPKSSYKEYNPTTMAIIQILIGLVVGIALMLFIVVPAKTNSVKADAQKTQAELEARITDLSTQLSKYEGEVPEGTETEISEQEYVPEDSDKKIEMKYQDLQTLLTAYSYYQQGDTVSAAETLMEMNDPDSLDEEGKAIYDSISYVLDTVVDGWYSQGVMYFEYADYEAALERFTKVYEKENTTGAALYYMGLCYASMNENDKANERFQEYLDTFPNGQFAENCRIFIGS